MANKAAFNVEKYKTFYECDEHWELRRMFMERHKDRFDEDELETMTLIAELSKEVAAEYRQSRENKLKRTFVAASDAAAARYAKK
ncbi:hypothetical protein quinque_008237 [Culex quinquefasciatus]